MAYGPETRNNNNNTISLGVLKFYVVIQKVASEAIEYCGFNTKFPSRILTYYTQNNLDYLKIEIVKVNPQGIGNNVIPTICALSKYNMSWFIHQNFGHVLINSMKLMARKLHMKGLPTNIPDLEDPFPIFLLTKVTKIFKGLTIEVSKVTPGFMLQMDFVFFNVEKSVGLTQILWLYVVLLHAPLVSNPQENFELLTSSNFFSLH